MKFHILTTLFLVVFLTSCAKPPEFGGISIGMTEAQTISKLGQPNSVAVKGNTKYHEYESYWGLSKLDYTRWFVRFVDEKVESFGKLGDFDSTKDNTQNINIKLDQVPTSSEIEGQNNSNIETELLKYKRLKDQGLIDESEYKLLRKKALGM